MKFSLKEPNDGVTSRAKRNYPQHYAISDNVFLVQQDTIANNVAIAAGIKGENRIQEASGIVFKLNGIYSGFASRSLWDWLRNAEEKS